VVYGICIAGEAERHWSLRYSSGLGITVSPAENSDNFPYALAMTGDAVYMLNDMFGLVPLSVRYSRFGFDSFRYAYANGIQGSALGEVDGSAWMLSYAPGVYLLLPLTERVREYLQINAGVNHFESSIDALDASRATAENRLCLNLAVGFEFQVTERSSLVAGIEYFMAGKPDPGIWYFDKSKHTKFYDILFGAKVDLF
jgi:hypothetical protein